MATSHDARNGRLQQPSSRPPTTAMRFPEAMEPVLIVTVQLVALPENTQPPSCTNAIVGDGPAAPTFCPKKKELPCARPQTAAKLTLVKILIKVRIAICPVVGEAQDIPHVGTGRWCNNPCSPTTDFPCATRT